MSYSITALSVNGVSALSNSIDATEEEICGVITSYLKTAIKEITLTYVATRLFIPFVTIYKRSVPCTFEYKSFRGTESSSVSVYTITQFGDYIAEPSLRIQLPSVSAEPSHYTDTDLGFDGQKESDADVPLENNTLIRPFDMCGILRNNEEYYSNVYWNSDIDPLNEMDTGYRVPSYEKRDDGDYIINHIYCIYQDEEGRIYSRDKLLNERPKFQDNLAYYDYPGLRAVKSCDFQVNNTSIAKYTMEQAIVDKELRVSAEYKPAYTRCLGQETYSSGYTHNVSQGNRMVYQVASGYQTPQKVLPKLTIHYPVKVFWFSNCNSIPIAACPSADKRIVAEYADPKDLIYRQGSLYKVFRIISTLVPGEYVREIPGFRQGGTGIQLIIPADKVLKDETGNSIGAAEQKNVMTREFIQPISSRGNINFNYEYTELIVKNIFVTNAIHALAVSRVTVALTRLSITQSKTIDKQENTFEFQEGKYAVESMTAFAIPLWQCEYEQRVTTSDVKAKFWCVPCFIEKEHYLQPVKGKVSEYTKANVNNHIFFYRPKSTIDSVKLSIQQNMAYNQHPMSFYNYLTSLGNNDVFSSSVDGFAYMSFSLATALDRGQPAGHVNLSRLRDCDFTFYGSKINASRSRQCRAFVVSQAMNIGVVANGTMGNRYG